MKRTVRRLAWFVVLAASATAANGDVKTQAVRETTEFVMRKFAKEAAEEGAEVLSKQIETLAVKHGDDALSAVRNVGPKALRIAQEAGEQSGPAVRAMARFGDDGVEWIAKNPQGLALATRYGDDAAAALVKHKGAAAPLVEQFGKPGVAALKAIEPQAGRRLAILAESGELQKIGRTPELLDVIAKYGDRAANFVWNNKGALAVGAGLTAFLANPEPFIDGTTNLAGIVGETAVKPLIAIPGKVA